MPEYSGPHRVPEGADANNIPGDLVALAETIIPAMTTAQIDALDWSRKPAGRFIAYDTTKGRLVVSTGAEMVNVIDARGGNLGSLNIVASGAIGSTGLIELLSSGTTLTVRAGTTALSIAKDGAATLSRATVAGDTDLTLVTKDYVDDVIDAVGDVADSALTAANAALPKAGGTMSGRPVIHQASGYSQIVLRNANAAYWISTDPGASDALTVAVLNKDTLSYVETALAITPDGHVGSASHVGGVVTATTDFVGWHTVTLPSAPTGNWAVTVSPVVGIIPVVAAVYAVTGTSATFAFWRTDTGAALASTSVTFHYHAIAY